MTITKIFLLLVCAFVLVLLLSTIFNKYPLVSGEKFSDKGLIIKHQ